MAAKVEAGADAEAEARALKRKFDLELRLRNEEAEFRARLRGCTVEGYAVDAAKYAAGYEGWLNTSTRGNPKIMFLVPHTYPMKPPTILLPDLDTPHVHGGIVCAGLVSAFHRPHMGLLQLTAWLERVLDGLEDVEPCAHQQPSQNQ
jgi:hypothetical protein